METSNKNSLPKHKKSRLSLRKNYLSLDREGVEEGVLVGYVAIHVLVRDRAHTSGLAPPRHARLPSQPLEEMQGASDC